MATYAKQFLSGSTNGRGIKVAATATPGTTLHTSHATDKDEIFCWLTNTHTAAVDLTLEFGGTTSPDDHLAHTVSLPALSGPIPIVTGQVLSGAVVMKAFASVTNVLIATGYVNRIT